MTTNQKWHLRKLSETELDALYTGRMEEDFPSAERPSLNAMHIHMQKGLQEILMMTDGTRDAAYAVCAEANGIVLVTLLAVFKEGRGSGHGTRLLELLRKHYAQKRAILLEVEDPADAEDNADEVTRTKRISFYKRNGYRFLEGIDHHSFGVHLLLMAFPLEDTFDNLRASAVEDVQAIYHVIIPAEKLHRVTTREM